MKKHNIAFKAQMAVMVGPKMASNILKWTKAGETKTGETLTGETKTGETKTGETKTGENIRWKKGYGYGTP